MESTSNPYVSNAPVAHTRAFVEQTELSSEIYRILRRRKENFVILYGHPRSGKTTILQHIASQLSKNSSTAPVYFSAPSTHKMSLDNLLMVLANTVADAFNQPQPDLGTWPQRAFQREWLPQILADHLSDGTLLLLWDELEAQIADEVISYLQQLLVSLGGRLQVLMAMGHNLVDIDIIPEDNPAESSKDITWLPMPQLSHEQTSKLVQLSEDNGTLRWRSGAEENVWMWTRGHPYLTQQLCSQIWERAHDLRPTRVPIITPDAVNAAIPDTLEDCRAMFLQLWDELGAAEHIFVSALASAGPGPIAPETYERILKQHSLTNDLPGLEKAPQRLHRWGLIDYPPDGVCICAELLRRWIAENHPFHNVCDEFDSLDPGAEENYKEAEKMMRQGQFSQARELLDGVIASNPNHAGAHALTANILIVQDKPQQAAERLRELHQRRPNKLSKWMTKALLAQAQHTDDTDEKLKLYNQVLHTEKEHQEAEGYKKEILKIQGDRQLEAYHAIKAQHQEGSSINWQEAQDHLHKARDKYEEAGLEDEKEIVEKELARCNLEGELKKLHELERLQCYPEALQMARRLAEENPEQTPSELNLEQLENSARLSPSRPRDYVRLLWWAMVMPKQLSIYREIFTDKTAEYMGSWITSALIWFPLFILMLAKGLGILPHVAGTPAPIISLFLSFCLALAGWWTGWRGPEAGKTHAVFAGIVAFFIAGTATGCLSGSVEVGIVLGFMLSLALGGAFSVARSVAGDYQLSILRGVTFGVASSAVFSVFLCVMFGVVGSGSARLAMCVLGDTPMDLAAGFIANITLCISFILMYYTLTPSLDAVLKNSLKREKYSVQVIVVPTAMIIGYLLLLWFSFLGGWRWFV